MSSESPLTYFDSPERASAEALQADHVTLNDSPFIRELIDGMPDLVLLLNRQRQIVLANQRSEDLLKIPAAQLIGLRVGEAIDCEHARELPAGCGTTQFCQMCGAAKAIHHSQTNGEPDMQECRISACSRSGSGAFDFRVWASPLEVSGETFTLFAVRDITDEKRREILERIFFHDVLNSAGGLQGILDVWPELKGQEALEMESMARDLAVQLLEEIESQRDLAAAERGDLKVTMEDIDVGTMLQSICSVYRHHGVASGKQISWHSEPNATICSSPLLLRRVLGNLLKNALEASKSGQTVEVRFVQEPVPGFRVHNETVMPKEVQLQMFQRSFSTKAKAGRGIGSYSVKLLAETYLDGKVSFTSQPQDGTTFTVELPHSVVA